MICYENRNGLMLAYDVESGNFLLDPFVHGAAIEEGKVWANITPEDVAAKLKEVGATEVYVYRIGAPWLADSCTTKVITFRRSAKRATPKSPAWKAVPVSRIADGSDWSDIYGN
jgi:hypothetical protein